MDAERAKEEIKVKGENLVKIVKDLVREGNIRRISIRDKDDKTIAEFPLSVGVVGALVAPALAGIGAIAALLTECTISIERE